MGADGLDGAGEGGKKDGLDEERENGCVSGIERGMMGKPGNGWAQEL
jgi:hypothetical protein